MIDAVNAEGSRVSDKFKGDLLKGIIESLSVS